MFFFFFWGGGRGAVHLRVIPNLQKRCKYFETDTTVRVFVVDVSINWPSNRNWQTKVLDSWKATQLYLLRQKSVNVPANMLMYLRDGSAQTSLRAATLRQIADQTVYLTQSSTYADTGPTSADLVTPELKAEPLTSRWPAVLFSFSFFFFFAVSCSS